MEIKSFKIDPSIKSTDKQHQDNTEAVSQPMETIAPTTCGKKKLLVQKPPHDDGKAKQIRVKHRDPNEGKPPKRQAVEVRQPAPENNPPPTQVVQDDETKKRQEIEDMIEAMDPNFHHKKKAMKEVEFIFDQNLYDGSVPYHQEGNMEYYTKDNEKKRQALKIHPLVQDALNNVINLYEFDSDGTLKKAGYTKMHMLIAKFIRKDLKEKALNRVVDQDWKYDSKDKGYMTKEELYNSLFELGDVWTPDIDVYHGHKELRYVAFFQKLKKILRGEEENAKSAGEIPDKKDNPYNILG